MFGKDACSLLPGLLAELMTEVITVRIRHIDDEGLHLAATLDFCDKTDLRTCVDEALQTLSQEDSETLEKREATKYILAYLGAAFTREARRPFLRKVILAKASNLGRKPRSLAPPAITQMTCRVSACEECPQVRELFDSYDNTGKLVLGNIGAAAVKHVQRQLESNGARDLATWDVCGLDTKRGLTVCAFTSFLVRSVQPPYFTLRRSRR